jgi:hypothetical protein
VKALNVDLSTVTTAADLVLGLGDPLEEIVQLDFQSSAAAWKHADVMVYHSLLYAHYHVPVHTIVVLLRPEAAHANMSGAIRYTPRPGHGSMEFCYELFPVWEHPVNEFLTGDVGVAPLAMLAQLSAGLSLVEGLTAVAQQVVERVTREAPPAQAKKLLTDALLLTGLRVRRDLAVRIFRGVRIMEESDTYLMIRDEGELRGRREDILLFGEALLGAPAVQVKTELGNISDLDRLKRMVRRAATARSWQEILDTL